MKNVFFYGLFMDDALLVERGLKPRVIGPAVLWNYRIHIAARATLLPAGSQRALGVVMQLTEEELSELYAEPSVRDYAPTSVEVELLGQGETITAECYNLPTESALTGTNPSYAARLSQLVERLDLDPEYVGEIRGFIADAPEADANGPTDAVG